MTFDELIAQGIRDTLAEKCAEYCPTREKHRFSITYKIGRGDIIRFQGKSAPLSVRSIKYILTAFALLGCGLFKCLFKERSK